MFIDIHTHNSRAGKSIININLDDHFSEVPSDKPFSIGLHPWYLQEKYSVLLPELFSIAKSQNCVAIGECGMDKLINTPEILQKDAFLEQARLAEDFNLPMIIHCVKYYYELLKIRKDNGFRTPWIFHGFTQNTDIALKIVASGCYISFGENLCNPSKKIKNCVEKIETNHIFLETDDSSDNIATIYEYYSSLKGVSMESIQIQIEQNLKKCFPNSYATLLA